MRVSNLALAIYDAPLWNMASIACRLHLVGIATVISQASAARGRLRAKHPELSKALRSQHLDMGWIFVERTSTR